MAHHSTIGHTSNTSKILQKVKREYNHLVNYGLSIWLRGSFTAAHPAAEPVRAEAMTPTQIL